MSDAVAAHTSRPGYLGPTSYAAILPPDDENVVSREHPDESEGAEEQYFYQHPLTKTMRMHMAADVFKSLRHYKTIRTLAKTYCTLTHTGYVAASLGVSAIDALEKTVDEFQLTTQPPDTILIERVLDNTSRTLEIAPSLAAQDFYKTCTGLSLRFEILGWIFATAGRSWLYGSSPDTPRVPGSWKEPFIHEMLRSSTICLMLSTLHSPANDIMVWMSYENLLLTCMMCGYSSKLIAIAVSLPLRSDPS